MTRDVQNKFKQSKQFLSVPDELLYIPKYATSKEDDIQFDKIDSRIRAKRQDYQRCLSFGNALTVAEDPEEDGFGHDSETLLDLTQEEEKWSEHTLRRIKRDLFHVLISDYLTAYGAKPPTFEDEEITGKEADNYRANFFNSMMENPVILKRFADLYDTSSVKSIENKSIIALPPFSKTNNERLRFAEACRDLSKKIQKKTSNENDKARFSERLLHFFPRRQELRKFTEEIRREGHQAFGVKKDKFEKTLNGMDSACVGVKNCMAKQIGRNIRFIASHIRRFCVGKLELVDAIQEMLVLCDSELIEGWDYRRGIKITTYLKSRLESKMPRIIPEYATTIRVPEDERTKIYRLEKERENNVDDVNYIDPYVEDISLLQTAQIIRGEVSIDAPINYAGNRYLLDNRPSKNVVNVFDRILYYRGARAFAAVLEKMPEKKRDWFLRSKVLETASNVDLANEAGTDHQNVQQTLLRIMKNFIRVKAVQDWSEFYGIDVNKCLRNLMEQEKVAQEKKRAFSLYTRERKMKKAMGMSIAEVRECLSRCDVGDNDRYLALLQRYYLSSDPESAEVISADLSMPPKTVSKENKGLYQVVAKILSENLSTVVTPKALKTALVIIRNASIDGFYNDTVNYRSEDEPQKNITYVKSVVTHNQLAVG